MVEYSIEVDAKALANNLNKWEQEFPGFIREMFGRWNEVLIDGANARAKTVLNVISGDLSGSHDGTPTENSLVFINTMRYAGVHEFGFSGTVTVPAHTRSVAFGKPTKPYTVGPYSRRMNIPARPFVKPTLQEFFARGVANDMADALFDWKKRKAGFQ